MLVRIQYPLWNITCWTKRTYTYMKHFPSKNSGLECYLLIIYLKWCLVWTWWMQKGCFILTNRRRKTFSLNSKHVSILTKTMHNTRAFIEHWKALFASIMRWIKQIKWGKYSILLYFLTILCFGIVQRPITWDVILRSRRFKECSVWHK